MVLYSLGYNAIALNSESSILSDKFIDEFNQRFDRIIYFYDNDKPGINYSNKAKEITGYDYILIPEEYNTTKDISDFTEKYTINETKILLDSLL